MTTLDNFDHWLFRGLRGVLKLITLRARYDAAVSKQILAEAKIHERTLQNAIVTMEDQALVTPNKSEEQSSLASLDHYVAQGYVGLNNMILERLNCPAEYSLHSLDLLIIERDKLTKLINTIKTRMK